MEQKREAYRMVSKAKNAFVYTRRLLWDLLYLEHLLMVEQWLIYEKYRKHKSQVAIVFDCIYV